MLFTGLSECKRDFVVVGWLINKFVLLAQNDIAIIEITKIVVYFSISFHVRQYQLVFSKQNVS